jgi:HAD superfamily phosphatase
MPLDSPQSVPPQSASAAVNAIVVFDIDGVVRDVGGSYRRALADTVEQFTQGAYRPSQADIDALKAEGIWNNDWEASREMIGRYFEAQGKSRSQLGLDYAAIVDFFQRRYRGADPENPDSWTGYITQEPLLMQTEYLEELTQAGVRWGFFSGATRGSATYVLERRLGLKAPVLVAMEDAPGKPDPTGLIEAIRQLELNQISPNAPVLYVGDTVADMQTVEQAKTIAANRQWIGVGILPPHAWEPETYAAHYEQQLFQAGAQLVLKNVNHLNAAVIQNLMRQSLPSGQG